MTILILSLTLKLELKLERKLKTRSTSSNRVKTVSSAYSNTRPERSTGSGLKT